MPPTGNWWHTSRRRYPVREGIPVLLEEAALGPQNVKVQKMYKRNPLIASTFKDMPVDIDPRRWLPASATDVTYRVAGKGRVYILKFTKPN